MFSPLEWIHWTTVLHLIWSNWLPVLALAMVAATALVTWYALHQSK